MNDENEQTKIKILATLESSLNNKFQKEQDFNLFLNLI